MDGLPIKLRRAARLVVVDPDDRVFLVQYARGTGERFWAVPGGGLEGNETFAHALVREAREELGLTLSAAPPFVWENSIEFEAGGQWIRQLEQFFVLKVDHGWQPEGVDEAHRSEGILATRWWTIEQIKSASEQLVFPEDLAQRIELMSHGRRT